MGSLLAMLPPKRRRLSHMSPETSHLGENCSKLLMCPPSVPQPSLRTWSWTPQKMTELEEVGGLEDAAWNDLELAQQTKDEVIWMPPDQEIDQLMHQADAALGRAFCNPGQHNCLGQKVLFAYPHGQFCPGIGGRWTGDLVVCGICRFVHHCSSLGNAEPCPESIYQSLDECMTCPWTSRTFLSGQILSRTEAGNASFYGQSKDGDVQTMSYGGGSMSAELSRAAKLTKRSQGARLSRGGRGRGRSLDPLDQMRLGQQSRLRAARIIVEHLVFQRNDSKYRQHARQRLHIADARCKAYSQQQYRAGARVNLIHQVIIHANMMSTHAEVRRLAFHPRRETWLVQLLLRSWDHFVVNLYMKWCEHSLPSDFTFARVAMATLYSLSDGIRFSVQLPESKQLLDCAMIPAMAKFDALPPTQLIEYFVSKRQQTTVNQNHVAKGKKILHSILEACLNKLDAEYARDEEFRCHLEHISLQFHEEFPN